MRYFVSIGGASGSMYGIRLLQELHKQGHEVHLVISEGAKKILQHETTYTPKILETYAQVPYDYDDLCAGPASGSFLIDAMIVMPCSMKTLSAVAHGYGALKGRTEWSACFQEIMSMARPTSSPKWVWTGSWKVTSRLWATSILPAIFTGGSGLFRKNSARLKPEFE